MISPFFYGNPVPHDQFFGRGREVRRIVGRIASGQSTAIVGEPRVGKTSLLIYLAAPKRRGALYGESATNLIFSFVDIHTLGGSFNQAQFWSCALEPLAAVIAQEIGLKATHARCVENQFGGFVLGQFFTHLGRAGHRLVLLLDEFDALLHHPILNNAEFFGSLRSVASRSQGLTLVVASRRTLTNLNADAFAFSQGGSPYFNFFSEVVLGPLTQRDTDALLDRAGDRFSTDDRRFVADIAGGHPYLVQVAASALWEARQDDDTALTTRRLEVAESLCNEVAHTLDATWRAWSPAMQQVFGSVAAMHLRATTTLHTLDAPSWYGRVGAPYIPPIVKNLTQQDKVILLETITEHASIDELKTIFFKLGVDYDNACRESKEGKVQELIQHLERKERLHELVPFYRELSPQIALDTTTHPQPTVRFTPLPPEHITRNFSQELRVLKQQGFIAEDAATPGGWRVRPLVFLWWLVDAAGLLPTGARPLIEAAVKGKMD
ncbi:MAG: AAA-like domain-containing protein [Anaerolineae bacterium]|nr:AAA-like domain-containing protein [Anaerolineae bacterium]